MSKYDREIRKARNGGPDVLYEMLHDAGYEETNQGNGTVWKGHDSCVAWVEVIDGKRMLCIADADGNDARYIPAIVAHVLTLREPE